MAYDSTTIKLLREQVMQELGIGRVIPNAFFTSLAAGSFTSVLLQNAGLGTGQYGPDSGIFRPDAATSADYFRFAGDYTNTAGTLAVAPNYADTTVGTEVAEIWYKCGQVFRPDVEILNAINYCLQFEMFTSMAAFSDIGANDGDMASSATSSYTSSNATLTKSVTAARVPYGMRSLRVANSGASGYAESFNMRITGATTGVLEQVKAWAIVSVAAQTALVDLRNITGSTSIASATTTEADPQLVHIPWQPVPTSDTTVALRIGGASASCDVYANAIWIMQQSKLRMNFPSYVSETFKAPQIFYGRPTSGGFTSGLTTVYSAQSMEFIPLVETRDYDFVINQNDSNPYGIDLHRESRWYKDWPLFIEVRRPWSDVGTFTGTDETLTTGASVHTLVPRVKLYLLDHVLIPGYPSDEEFPKLRSIAQRELNDALKVRAAKPTARVQPYYAGIGYA